MLDRVKSFKEPNICQAMTKLVSFSGLIQFFQRAFCPFHSGVPAGIMMIMVLDCQGISAKSFSINPLTPGAFCKKCIFLDILVVFRLDLGQISFIRPKMHS